MGNPVKIPSAKVFMVSPRDYRLSSLQGTVVNFKQDIPIKVNPNAYLEALACGASMAEDQDLPDPSTEKKDQEDAVEAAKLEAKEKADALNTALTAILTRNDPEDFKKDGTPKSNRVIAELSPDNPRPTATEIADAYAVLQENLDLAED